MSPVYLTDRAMTLPRPAILYVENNIILQHAIKDTLELAGWIVESCTDGALAHALIESDRPYDLLMLDTELPVVNGLSLTRLARRLPHRRHTPILIFSLRDCATEARQAGATYYLKKPDFLLELVTTIKRLLDTDGNK